VLIVDCDPRFAPQLDEAYLETLASAVLAGEDVSGTWELSLLFTDDAGIRAINRQYRGIDSATDVVSFSLLPDATHTFIGPPDGILRLGDIVISYEHATAQATELGHSTRQEIGELFVHGLLHILGYDHEEQHEAAAMAERADRYTAPANGGQR
jgi:probable rRNA maturation factor